MTDDDISRRTVLGGLGALGAGAAMSGTGALAYLHDSESTSSSVTAGTLDLEITWDEYYNGERVDGDPDGDHPGPVFDLPDVKPGDHGEATICLSIDGNPGYVFMGGELTKNSEGDHPEPERKVDDTPDVGELADDIWARVWYDGVEGEDDGGNNEYDDGEVQIAAGTLSEVLDELSNGIRLADQTSSNAFHDDCTQLGDQRNEVPKVGETMGDGKVEFTGLYKEGGSVVGFDWESDVPICKIEVDGGNETETTTYDCETSGTAYAPLQPQNQNRTRYPVTHVRVYECAEDDGDGDGDGGDGWEPDTTQCLGFQWHLPADVGNEIQGDEVAFDLKFYAEQTRHNDDPDNPYGGDDGDENGSASSTTTTTSDGD